MFTNFVAGILQKGTNDQDGVPGITECAIAPGSSRTYTMHLEQFGTGWYHSHSLAQYGDGIRGPMLIHGPSTANYDYDMGTVMIDDTFPVTAQQQNERIAHFGPSGYVLCDPVTSIFTSLTYGHMPLFPGAIFLVTCYIGS